MKLPSFSLGPEEVRAFLPHRYPMILVDRVVEILPRGDLDQPDGGEEKLGTSIEALKCVSYGEMVFHGHFPQFAVYPGVLQIEAMAQTCSFAAYPWLQRMPTKQMEVALTGVDHARFRKPVVPGDQLRIRAKLIRCRGTVWVFESSCEVEGKKVAEAELMANLKFVEK
jgi:3-hydroxyacyl-[acyl-carrier-protein] dehydratase